MLERDLSNFFQLQIVATVLKLGNLNFVPVTNMDGTEGCRVENEYELYDVGELVKVEVDCLRSALLARCYIKTCYLVSPPHSNTRSVAAGAETLVSDLSAGEAAAARDALCRTMYSRLFTLIVARINEAIKVRFTF